MSSSQPQFRDFGSIVDVLNHVWNTHSQDIMDARLWWKFLPDRGHVEFYQYGPNLAAIPIYDRQAEKSFPLETSIELTRLELLVVGPQMSKDEVAFAVTEMIRMIKRKKTGPVTRRIK